jgi:FkbH-like protein
MNWLPLPADFRGCLRTLQTLQEPGERLQRLANLAQHRLGYVETIQVDRVLSPMVALQPAGFTPVRLALLASSTVDHLVAGIRVAGLRRGLLIETYNGQYGQYRQEILDPASPLHRFAPQVVLLSLTARDAVGAVALGATAADADATIARFLDGLRALWSSARDHLHATVIQQTFLDVAQPLFGSYERQVSGSPAQLVACLNQRLAAAAAAEGVLLLDVARAAERDGLDAWFDIARWLQGKLEIAPQAGPMYGELAVRVMAAQRGLSKKCLVLDLDNTLWGGTIGDDGIDGIVLGEGSAAGEAFLAMQRYAGQLRQRGIILAVCSKNDPQIAEQAFSNHPEMHLKRSDIAAFVANWNPKPDNLALIAAQLNIGLDSCVFVDDNPAERAAVRAALPMVAVPELPTDAAHYVRCVADAGYFESVAFTVDDQRRGEQYAGNLSREAARDASQSLDDFLASLQMTVVYGPFRPVDLARIAQLINKTNQFNTTTQRHSLDDVTRFAVEPLHITLQFRLLDKFGDNGLISAMILRPLAAQADACEIDTWVMSCRVFGRQLEYEAMNLAVEAARERGVRAIYGDYIPSAKNGVIKDLYQSLGFVQESGGESGPSRWLMPLETYQARDTHISRRVE